nr:TPM domain-containing protein [Oceanobacillus saliphilus]
MTLGTMAGASGTDRHIYDDAGLVNETELAQLEQLAKEHSEELETTFLFLTTNDAEGKDVVTYMKDFFDGWADENGQEDAVLLTIDMDNRDVFLAGFGSAETTLDDDRIDLVLDKVMPHIANQQYTEAFREMVVTSSKYMEFRPGVNPENLLFKWGFQLGVSVILAGVIVGIMAYNSGGRVTVTNRTYVDHNHTRVNSNRDRFINKTVTKRKKPSNNNKGGGGGRIGGGGVTGGGRSFSGGGRSF